MNVSSGFEYVILKFWVFWFWVTAKFPNLKDTCLLFISDVYETNFFICCRMYLRWIILLTVCCKLVSEPIINLRYVSLRLRLSFKFFGRNLKLANQIIYVSIFIFYSWFFNWNLISAPLINIFIMSFWGYAL